MRLVTQWRRIMAELPDTWEQAHLEFTPADHRLAGRAAMLLGPLEPGKAGATLRFTLSRGTAPGPDAVRRLLARLDGEGLGGSLTLVATAETDLPGESEAAPLAVAWDRLLSELPAGWSDLLCRLDFRSIDDLAPAALAVAPLNPSRDGSEVAFRFRVARRFGYGAAPEMARRCLTRLDETGISGDVRILNVLADTRPVATQGPVWIVDGRAV